MKVLVIDVGDLSHFMKLERLERELAVHLQFMLNAQKLVLKHTAHVSKLAGYLSEFKTGKYKPWYQQLDPEIKKVIDKEKRMRYYGK